MFSSSGKEGYVYLDFFSLFSFDRFSFSLLVFFFFLVVTSKLIHEKFFSQDLLCQMITKQDNLRT